MLPIDSRHKLLVLAVDLWLNELAGDCLSYPILGVAGSDRPDLSESASTRQSAFVVIRWHSDGHDDSGGTRTWLCVDDSLASGQCVEIESERIATEIAREHLSDGHRP